MGRRSHRKTAVDRWEGERLPLLAPFGADMLKILLAVGLFALGAGAFPWLKDNPLFPTGFLSAAILFGVWHRMEHGYWPLD